MSAPPGTVDCPTCFSYWYKDRDEAGRPYTCFGCHNRGFVTKEQAEQLNRSRANHGYASNGSQSNSATSTACAG